MKMNEENKTIIKIPGEFNYEKELRETLSKDAWLRHLFNKLGKRVVVYMDGDFRIEGRLLSIHYARGVINLEIEGDKTYYVNWKLVKFVAVEDR